MSSSSLAFLILFTIASTASIVSAKNLTCSTFYAPSSTVVAEGYLDFLEYGRMTSPGKVYYKSSVNDVQVKVQSRNGQSDIEDGIVLESRFSRDICSGGIPDANDMYNATETFVTRNGKIVPFSDKAHELRNEVLPRSFWVFKNETIGTPEQISLCCDLSIYNPEEIPTKSPRPSTSHAPVSTTPVPSVSTTNEPQVARGLYNQAAPRAAILQGYGAARGYNAGNTYQVVQDVQ